ncbi:MFS transporter [Burkholderia cepacia]|uniref:MFS transporter n=1 Tax=Burkholderia cepacia TaxID=292 RepID=UPI000ABABC82|nr:MFS transporter [Burkholderia cepacia]
MAQMEMDAGFADAQHTVPAQVDAIYRKVAWRVVPLLTICYIVAYLDRINISIAKLQMTSSIGLSDAAYGLGAGLFFIGYLFFEVPSNLILHRVGARIWIARIMITWGVVSALMAFVSEPWQFYVLRVLLGVAEAGFFPGVILYLTYWFPNHRRARITALFMIGIPLAGFIGNPLSGWVVVALDRVWGHAGWQWMFVVEALPTIPLALCVLLFLDNRPSEARWLTDGERKVIVDDIAGNDVHRESPGVLRVLVDGRIWNFILIALPVSMGMYTLSFFMPTMIHRAGGGGVQSTAMLSAIPYGVALVVMTLMARHSDRRRERRWHTFAAMMMGATGLCASVLAGNHLSLVVASLTLAACGFFSYAPIGWAIPTAMLRGPAAAVSIGLINSVASLGGFLGPFLYGRARESLHSDGTAVLAICAWILMSALLVLRFDPKKVNI